MMNDKGQSTSALYGFIRSVQKVIADFAPEYLVAVFDGPDNKKSRREVYADYKIHRESAPEDLYPQFEWAFEFCEAAGIPALCVEGVEADDTMATIARFAEKKKAKVLICSSDKDLMQLVNDDIHILNIHKDNLLIDAAGVQNAFGVKPDQMLDLLAIMGDASDNIPGLPGFGQKTAASLLQEFGTLDAILAHPEKVKGEKKQETLRKERALALMSRELATLDTNVEIPKTEEFYRLKEPKSPQALSDFYHRMNFNSLLRDLGAVPSPKKKAPIDRRDYRLIDTEPDLKKLLKELSLAKEICIDTETTSEKPMQAHLVGIGFCEEPGTAFYLPCNGELGESAVLSALREFFSTAKTKFYGHNLKYDWHVLANYGIELTKEQISFDTILASYLLQPQNRRHGLDDLTLDQFKKIKIPISDLIGKGKEKKTMLEVPIEQVKEYCCEDADMTAQLKELFEEELKKRKLDSLNRDVELPLLRILAKMERVGIYLDKEELKECSVVLARKIAHLKAAIFAAAGEEFNINSPKQLSQILYQKLGLQPPGRKKAETSTNASILEELVDQHPVVRHILDYRTMEKLRSTYIDALPEMIHPQTGRIHCTFNQSVAATGRLSCQDPNLQNIPIRGDLGKEIRSCFKPEKKGWSYLGADYSQIELRLLAHFSEDPELISAFRKGEDIHTHTAALIFGVEAKDVTPEMRFRAKAINFGILYGQGPYGLAKETGLSMHEASLFIKAYFERYPKVEGYIEACKKSVKKTGMAETLLGRQRPIPEINNQNPSIRSMAERLAVNTPLQGTAADLIKMAMIAIDRTIEEKRLEGSMILQIHDELIFEVPDNELLEFEIFVKKEMEGVFSLSVPIEVSIAIGKNWGEC
jgi:DNA polymerase-1